MLANPLFSLALIAERGACRGPRHVAIRTRGLSATTSNDYLEDIIADRQIWFRTGQGRSRVLQHLTMNALYDDVYKYAQCLKLTDSDPIGLESGRSLWRLRLSFLGGWKAVLGVDRASQDHDNSCNQGQHES